MALTVTVLKREASGSSRKRTVEVQFDSAYAPGGELFAPADVELTELHSVDFSHAKAGAATSTDAARYDQVNGKLLLFNAAGVEYGATDQSSKRVTLEVSGR
jgi:hypothetical protein